MELEFTAAESLESQLEKLEEQGISLTDDELREVRKAWDWYQAELQYRRKIHIKIWERQ